MNCVCAVVVTYNRLGLLKQCVAALKRQKSLCDILVIDNASTDGTKEWLDKQELICLHMETNTGGAGGFNAGMREAVIRGYDFVWVMDDDTFPNKDALEKLLEADKQLGGNYGWLSSVPLWIDGTICIMNKQKVATAYYEDIQFLQYGLLRAVHATFVSLFLKRDTILNVGLPIKDFFIWGDDIEYTRRISIRIGMPCYIAGQSQVIHAMKDNTGGNIAIDVPERLKRYNLAFRNENYLFRQEGYRGICYYFAKCGKYIVLSLVRAKNHRLKRAWIIVKQCCIGLFFNPKIEFITKSVFDLE